MLSAGIAECSQNNEFKKSLNYINSIPGWLLLLLYERSHGLYTTRRPGEGRWSRRSCFRHDPLSAIVSLAIVAHPKPGIKQKNNFKMIPYQVFYAIQHTAAHQCIQEYSLKKSIF